LPQYKTLQTDDDRRQTDRQTRHCSIGSTDSTVGQKQTRLVLCHWWGNESVVTWHCLLDIARQNGMQLDAGIPCSRLANSTDRRTDGPLHCSSPPHAASA